MPRSHEGSKYTQWALSLYTRRIQRIISLRVQEERIPIPWTALATLALELFVNALHTAPFVYLDFPNEVLGRKVPKPYTLNPTPYALHPIPYTLCPTPYTLHPTPYAPYTKP
jgi:hypothetical protein